MNGRLLIASAVVLAGAVASVNGADSWASKPYNTWTDVELKEVLNDSPWAGKGSITYSQTKGGTPSAIEDVALVSWVSAVPLRQAAVRQQLGATPSPSKEAESVLSQPMTFYVVSVKITGGPSSASYGNSAARMQADSFLMRDGKAPILSVQSEGRVLDKDGKVIEAPAPRGGAPGAPGGPGAPAPAGRSQQMQILPTAAAFQRGGGGFGGGGGGFGAPQGGGNRPRGVASVMVYMFPRTDAIAAGDKEVEFVSKLCGGGGFGGGAATCQYNVKRKFKLKDMTYNGELAL